MKKYTIKEVRKMEDRYFMLEQKDSAEYATLMGTLSTIAFGTGVILLSYVTKDSSQAETILANTCAAGFGLGGVGMFMDMITAHLRKVKLDKKLHNIYEKQGADFEYKVGGLYSHRR